MPSRIVYLHIPKSGGTSQRYAFFRVYGKERVFWHGINNRPDAQVFSKEELAPYTVIGGHRPLRFYPEDVDALFLSAVRDPVQRAVSLYSYYSKPHFAKEGGVHAREQQLAIWRQRGMDSDSLLRTLENCEQFRREIENYQCRYLSRYDESLDGVLRTLEQLNCMICDQAHTGKMNAALSQQLAWPTTPNIHINASLKNTHDIILREPGAREALEEVMKEDQKLFHFISEEHGGLYQNRTAGAEADTALIPAPVHGGLPDNELWRQVQLYSKGYVALDPAGNGCLGLVLINHGNTDLLPEAFPELAFDYCILDRQGRKIFSLPGAQPLQAPICKNSHLNVSLDISLEPSVTAQAHIIQIGLSLGPNQTVEDINPLHPASASILPLQ